MRWPGKIEAGPVSNEIIQHHDCPTFLAAAGDPGIVDKLKAGHTVGDTYKVHIDGYNLLPYLTREIAQSPRRGCIYFSDDCDGLGIRFENWKIVFMEQRSPATMGLWAEPFTPLRLPKVFNLRTDPTNEPTPPPKVNETLWQSCSFFSGAGCGNRTHDLMITSQVLYQLS